MSREKGLAGLCSICGEELQSVSAMKHLASCLAATPGTTEYVIAKAVGVGLGDADYWLCAAVPADASLENLDGFLRQIWLECCGHMSSFRQKRVEIDMSSEVRQLAVSGVKLIHEYDFGTTTELNISFSKKVIAANLPEPSKIKLLARNIMPHIPCDLCGQPAKQICIDCIYNGNGLLCDKCAEQHECEEGYRLPVVNSPRCGVCAYCG